MIKKMLKKIYYHDTDCAGVVYYANYLKYFEEARTEFLCEHGWDLKKLSSQGILFAVKNVEIDYKVPAGYGDTLEIFTEILKVKRASLVFLQQIKKKDTVLAMAKTTLVCVDCDFSPRPLPKEGTLFTTH